MIKKIVNKWSILSNENTMVLFYELLTCFIYEPLQIYVQHKHVFICVMLYVTHMSLVRDTLIKIWRMHRYLYISGKIMVLT